MKGSNESNNKTLYLMKSCQVKTPTVKTEKLNINKLYMFSTIHCMFI